MKHWHLSNLNSLFSLTDEVHGNQVTDTYSEDYTDSDNEVYEAVDEKQEQEVEESNNGEEEGEEFNSNG